MNRTELFYSYFDTICHYFENIGTLNIFMALLAIISFWFAYKTYIKDCINIAAPRYITRTSNIINRSTISTTNTISVTYHNKVIDTLTITKLAFWNKGKVTIDKNIIADKDPITINIINGATILDYEIQFSNKANNVILNLSPQGNSISVDFDFLAYNQGFVVKLYHTGTLDTDIILDGSLKTGDKIKRYSVNAAMSYSNETFVKNPNEKEKSNNNLELERKQIGWVITIICILIVIFLIHSISSGNILFSIFGYAEIIFLLLLLMGFGIFLIKRRVPKEITKIFYDNK